VHGSAAVRFGQLTDDSKSKTKAAVRTRYAAVRLSNALKDGGKEQWRDPFTGVVNADDRLTAFARQNIGENHEGCLRRMQQSHVRHLLVLRDGGW
jgi:hypothetical protein